MKYTEVLEQVKQASQTKQAGIWGSLGKWLSKWWDPATSAVSKLDMPNGKALGDMATTGARIRSAAADAAHASKHTRYKQWKTQKAAQHTKDLLNSQRATSKSLQDQYDALQKDFQALQGRFDESQAFNQFLRGHLRRTKDQAQQAAEATTATQKGYNTRATKLQKDLTEARQGLQDAQQGINLLGQQVAAQTARGNKWRGRTWKAGAAAVPLTGGAYLLGRINKSEGTPRQTYGYMMDAEGNPVLDANGQPVPMPDPGQIARPGTYENWLNSRLKKKK